MFTLIAVMLAPQLRAVEPSIERMPAELETQFALSALPPKLRNQATVYLLDPSSGYWRSQHGNSGMACLVERTVWELSDFRNDIYIPLCYDAAGTKAHLKVIRDAAALRAQGLNAIAVKTEIEKRYKNKTYRTPERPGLSYMLGPIMRTVGPPDLEVRTMAMPHVMFYAPGVTNEDIGARPSLSEPASLRYPFIDKQGNTEQTYIIQLVGETEKAQILGDEHSLVTALCAYREVLCLSNMTH